MPSSISWFPWSVEPKACSLKLRLNGPCICGKVICRKPSCHSATLVHMTREIALDWAPPHIPTSFYRVTWSTVTLWIYYNFAQLSKLSQPVRILMGPAYLRMRVGPRRSFLCMHALVVPLGYVVNHDNAVPTRLSACS